MRRNRGVVIAFEGPEGSGKTTQASLLYQYLTKMNLPCVLFREPGGTAVSEKIREILLNPEFRNMDPKTELLLYLASRAQLVAEKIIPALAEGKIVIADRFSDSSLAYQGAGRKLGMAVVSRLNKFATAKMKPDLTILIDTPIEVGMSRLKGNLAAPCQSVPADRSGATDRMESEEQGFHERVRDAYLFLAKRRGRRMKVFSGTKEKEELHLEIRTKVIEFLNQKGVI